VQLLSASCAAARWIRLFLSTVISFFGCRRPSARSFRHQVLNVPVIFHCVH
jgi:hypothetical protein